MTFNFNMPAVNRQVFVAGYFDKFKSGHMREALIQACQKHKSGRPSQGTRGIRARKGVEAANGNLDKR